METSRFIASQAFPVLVSGLYSALAAIPDVIQGLSGNDRVLVFFRIWRENFVGKHAVTTHFCYY